MVLLLIFVHQQISLLFLASLSFTTTQMNRWWYMYCIAISVISIPSQRSYKETTTYSKADVMKKILEKERRVKILA